ncbi:four helix bundle protein [Flavisolibacter sp. BT320]|nr:four helix bundle protein [Flavisolibacter longurius]
MSVKNFKQTKVYQKAFHLAMEIFALTKQFPTEEKYSLTDQVRRSSRSICACLAEAYRKKQYPSHFVSKVSDADMENSETGVWLDFSLSCSYISHDQHSILLQQSEEIGRLLGHMIQHPELY